MTDRSSEDRTRDIRLPPLPDRPSPVLPAGWVGPQAAPGPADVAPVGEQARSGEPAPEEVDPDRAEALRLAGRRTDELHPPPGSVARERTLAFSSPEMRHRSIEPVRVEARPRRWPWVVLTLLPIVVIVASAVAWLILLRGS